MRGGAASFGESTQGPPTQQEAQRERDVQVRGGMTKAELVEHVAKTTQLTKKHAELIVNTVFESIVESLREGEKIELRGFGSFRIRQRGSRIGRNHHRCGWRCLLPAVARRQSAGD